MRAFAFVAAAALAGAAATASAGDVERGQAVFIAANCESCHTDARNDGALLAGGRAMQTPFGTFYTPNITPDPETGIGRWTDAEFAASLTHGRAPDGSRYYPVFPYTSYAGMTEQDILDLKAYIFSLPAVEQPNRPHELRWPFSWRWLMRIWQFLFFDPVTFAPDPTRDEVWNRGAYLATVLGHCDECHTPRNLFGAMRQDMLFAGTREGPLDEVVPNITPDEETGIGSWRQSDITWLLRTGFLPDGDTIQNSMSDVVYDSTSHMPDEDLAAIAAYLLALPPIRNDLGHDHAHDH